jgi:hypothetical protein
MTDAPAKKRPWLQYHLSTAVVLMFVAAGLLWLNMTRRSAEDFGYWTKTCRGTFVNYRYTDYGWPVRCVSELSPTEVGGKRIEPPRTFGVILEWQWLACDVIVALIICGTTAILCEQLIRRKERRHD